MTLPWIACDAEHARNAILIDIDHPDGIERAERIAAYGLPRPTLVIDPWSGRSHALWRLATPAVAAPKASSKSEAARFAFLLVFAISALYVGPFLLQA